MELKSLLLPEKTVTFDFPGCEGLKFDLTYLSKESNQAIVKKCQVQEFDPKTRQPLSKFDDELFLKLYVSNIVKGWQGFKLKFLRELVLADIPLADENKELDYSEDNAIELMKNSQIFDNWVSEVISDLENFTKNKSKLKLIVSKDTSEKADQD